MPEAAPEALGLCATTSALRLHIEYRHCVLHGAGVAGAVSRTATAPVDRMKLLLQVDNTARGLTVRESWARMVAEGTEHCLDLCICVVRLKCASLCLGSESSLVLRGLLQPGCTDTAFAAHLAAQAAALLQPSLCPALPQP